MRAPLLVLLVLSSPSAAAQGLDDSATGAARLALGGATVAVHDPTALWGNPALLSLVGPRLALGLEIAGARHSVFRTGSTVNAPEPEARELGGAGVRPTVSLSWPLWGERLAVATPGPSSS
jgi:hypothetical protein